MSRLQTPITEMFGIEHPILLAGMNVAAGPELAAAVSNAGGLGVIGGLGYTPKMLRSQIQAVKKDLKDPKLPFGVDLLLPKVGGTARKTNYDYTKGALPELIDVIIEEKTTLFVCAIGVPPKEVVDKLHGAGIYVMNMVGHPTHVKKAIAAGVDLICAQAGEGGGHTGDVPASILIPACVDLCKGHKSPLTGKPVYVIGAGGVYDGRSLVANLAYGAQAVWVGTRFVASEEASAPKAHKEALLKASWEDAVRTLIFTGRPLRVSRTPYVDDWNNNRQAEIQELLSKGIIPHDNEMEKVKKDPEQFKKLAGQPRPWLIGRVSSLINDVLPAKTIVDNMISEAVQIIERDQKLLTGAKPKL